MSKVIDKNIGLRIRQKREALSYSREQLSELADMSPTFLANIELGSIGFSESTLIKICKVLGVSADFLLFGNLSGDKFATISQMLFDVDEKYLPHLESIISAYVKSILLSQKHE